MKMIESSVLGTSPWNCDQLLSKDMFPFSSSMDSNNILDINSTELENDVDWLEKMTLSSCSTSSVHSISTASSEADDWVSHDFGSDSLSNDYSLSSSEILFPRVFDEDSIIDPLGLNSFELTPAFPDSLTDCTTSNDSSSDNIPSFPNSPKHKKKRQSPDPFSASKSWSRMTCEEQLETVEALTQIISREMGLREQLEIIRIIDPSAVVSPADTEFVIDLAFLNDAKLQLIRDFIIRCSFVLPRGGLGNHVTSTKCSLPSQNSGSKTNLSSTHNSTYPRKLSKKQTREKRPQLKALNMRQRKEYRQLLKERRSGLFIKEEVLSLSTCHLKEEDEDINILE